MIEADTLITGATIVTMDATRRIIAGGALAMAGGRIVAVGKDADVVPLVRAAETIDGRRFVMTPGFINGHVHVTETLIRGFMPENLDFDEAVWRWAVPLYERQSAAEQALGARLSAVGMLRAGTRWWRRSPRPASGGASANGCRTVPSRRAMIRRR